MPSQTSHLLKKAIDACGDLGARSSVSVEVLTVGEGIHV